MSKYDFDKITDRSGTGSLKWDIKEGELPLWVADMDFEVAPEIRRALISRLENGIYGYNIIPDEWYDAYISWWKRKHNFEFQKDWLIYCTGVVPAISSLVRKLTTPNENVVLLTPVYNIFFNSIINNGARVLECPLIYNHSAACSCEDAGNAAQCYFIDFKLLEKYLADPQTTLLIFCNPHNPVGRIWSAAEMKEIGRLCKENGVTVISDEIHCDITEPGIEYIPFASVSEACRDISITAIAPTKAFNIAGLCTSAVVVPNKFLRNRVNRCLNTDEIAEPGTLAVPAAVAAFNEGEEWLRELCSYVSGNRSYLTDFIKANCPKLKAIHGQATYLMWIDVSATGLSGDIFAEKLRARTGLYLCGGSEYGRAGAAFVRLNLACPRKLLEDAAGRLLNFYNSLTTRLSLSDNI